MTITRIRKVKCDEVKPECNRCTSTGRKCEGYEIGPPTRQSQRRSQTTPSQSGSKTTDILVVHRQPHSTIFGTSEDSDQLRSFEYFQSRVKDIAGYFESDFWSRLVLQISHTENAVLYALLALSSVYEMQEYRQNGHSNSDCCSDRARNQIALQQYNKAICILSKKLSENQMPLTVTLVTCILFVRLEFLRNDYEAGLKHLFSGLKILQYAHSASPVEFEIERVISPLFERLKTQVAFHGAPESAIHSCAFAKFAGTFLPSSILPVRQAWPGTGVTIVPPDSLNICWYRY